MRLIDADAFEHKLRSVINFGQSRDLEGVSELQAVLRDLEQMTAVQEWIPCSEKLPKEENTYLCTYATNTGRCTGTCDYDIEDGLGWCFWFDAQKKWKPVSNVIAWMPLPKPYKEPKAITHCKDCEHFSDASHSCLWLLHTVGPEDFCSRARPRA